MLKKLFAFLLILLPIVALQKGFSYHVAKFLLPGETHSQEAQSLMQKFTHTNRVQIFCQAQEDFSFWKIFQSNRLHLEIEDGADYTQYKEQTAHEIHQAHRQRKEWVEGKAMPGKDKYIDLKKNSNTCYGIHTELAYNLTLETTATDKWRLSKFSLGFILWLAAPQVEDSHYCLYSVTAFLGYQLATWIMIYITGHLRLVLEGSLWTAFQEMLYERPSTMALALTGCFYALALGCRRFDHILFHHGRFRQVHRCALRSIAYWLIYSASDHREVGIFCLLYLFFYTKIWLLLRYPFWGCRKVLRLIVAPPNRLQFNEAQQEASQAISQANYVASENFIWPKPSPSNSYRNFEAAGATSMPTIQRGTAAHPPGFIFRGHDMANTSRTTFRGRCDPSQSSSTTTLYYNMNYSESMGDTREQL
ncbi:uncharacterized protein LOC117588013 [Drosophila guanche]|uniref:Uncharacterized protein n=1 Tax=Drosophila guanche TaxID=7266 RepID=A0A3B0KJV6_DROGU|nr:uncharacterized protein LOC117588013 [Drosophila guanche]SPP86036.1 Hypothetical predicted protein [Drosophila guanche]